MQAREEDLERTVLLSLVLGDVSAAVVGVAVTSVAAEFPGVTPLLSVALSLVVRAVGVVVFLVMGGNLLGARVSGCASKRGASQREREKSE
jgi:hypothetical protein